MLIGQHGLLRQFNGLGGLALDIVLGVQVDEPGLFQPAAHVVKVETQFPGLEQLAFFLLVVLALRTSLGK